MPPEQRDSVDRLVEEVCSVYPFIDAPTEGAVDRIGKLHRYLEQLWERTAEDFDLNKGGYKVLLCLREAEGRVKTPGVLARDCLISTGAMTNRIDRLEARGYVERVRDSEDRRSVRVHLTAKGDEVLERAVVEQAREEKEALSVLSGKEMATLNALLRKLMLVFEQPGAD